MKCCERDNIFVFLAVGVFAWCLFNGGFCVVLAQYNEMKMDVGRTNQPNDATNQPNWLLGNFVTGELGDWVIG